MQLVSRAEGACTGNWRTPCKYVVERQSPCFNQGFGRQRYCIHCFERVYAPDTQTEPQNSASAFRAIRNQNSRCTAVSSVPPPDVQRARRTLRIWMLDDQLDAGLPFDVVSPLGKSFDVLLAVRQWQARRCPARFR